MPSCVPSQMRSGHSVLAYRSQAPSLGSSRSKPLSAAALASSDASTGSGGLGQALANPPYQQRNVRTLPAAIGVQFIQHQEPKTGAVADDVAIESLLPGHQELEHHEVCLQDVRRVVGDPPALHAVLLARVALAGHRSPGTFCRNFSSSSCWLLASAFIG